MSDLCENSDNNGVKLCENAGNPVFSCMLKPEYLTPWDKKNNPLFKTTSSDYGRLPPTRETAVCVHHPRTTRFTKKLWHRGMYRDSSFNTSLDKSKVSGCMNLHNTI